MNKSRRVFMAGAARAGVLAACASVASAGEPAPREGETVFKVIPIGKVEKQGQTSRIRIFDAYVDGLLGLDAWSHVHVFYWFDQNDVPQKRRILRVSPRGDKNNPETGVFACRSPVRPNLIALSVCKIVSVEKNIVTLDDIDAFDATPVLDLKPFIPMDAPPSKDVRVPDWARRGRP